MNALARCDSGACSKARRTSRRTATGPGRKLAALGWNAREGDERRNSRAVFSNVSSVTYIGWNCASPVPTTGPNGTNPRC